MQDARPPGQDQLTAEVTAAAAPVPPQDVVELFDKEVGVAYVLRVTTLGVLNYTFIQNQLPLISEFVFVNNTTVPLTDVKVKISFKFDFIESFDKKFANVGPGKMIEIVPSLDIHAKSVFELTESMTDRMVIRVENGDGEILQRFSTNIVVIPLNQWSGTSLFPESIASFVMPNIPALISLKNQASEFLRKQTGESFLSGYQTGDKNFVRQQMAAIYAAIYEQSINYAELPAAFEKRAQQVRTPNEVLAMNQGNCIEMAVLYSSLCEAFELHPIIIIMRGHAFVGVWLTEETFDHNVVIDYSELNKRLAEGINDIEIVESTHMNRERQAGFEQAVQKARGNLSVPENFVMAIDIYRSHMSGIRPLPLRVQIEGEIKIVDYGLADDGNQKAAVAKTIEEHFLDTTEVQTLGKRDLWMRSLLDLSLRNGLISFRPGRRTVQLFNADLPSLEDALAQGESFTIREVVNDWQGDLKNIMVDVENESELISRISETEFKSKRLRTFLSKTELEKTLKTLYRDAKVSMEENGANTLYLAMGFLRWINPKDSTDSNGKRPHRLAPLVLLPVDLVRRSQGSYKLTLRDEDAQLNITLLEKLQQDFNLTIGGLDPLPLDDFGVDLTLVFNSIRRAVMHMPGWDVIETAFLGLFSFSQFVMWNDLKERMDRLAENKVVAGLLEGHYDNFDDNEIKPADLDQWLQTDAVVIPTSVDSSQLAAIVTASQGNSFVLHGPPGTGKSQTITNMIANALYNGQSVLFVAEKMAALNVVQERLAGLGLADYVLELHSNKTRKQAVLQKLEQNMKLEKQKDLRKYKRNIAAIQRAKKELNAQVVSLHQIRTCGRSLYDLLVLYQQHSTGFHPFHFDPEVLRLLTPVDWDRWLEWVRRAGHAAERLNAPSALHPLREFKRSGYALNQRSRVGTLLVNLIRQTKLFKDQLADKDDLTKQLLSDRTSLSSITELSALCRERNLKTPLDAVGIEHFFDPDAQGVLAAVKERALEVRSMAQALYQDYNPGIETLNWQKLKQQLLEAEKQFFLVRNRRIHQALQPLNALTKSHFTVEAGNAPVEIDRIVSYQATRQQLFEAIQKGQNLFNVMGTGDLETDIDTLEDLAAIGHWMQEQHNVNGRSSEELSILYEYSQSASGRNAEETENLLESFISIDQQLRELGQLCGLDADAILNENDWLQTLPECLERWYTHIDDWKLWSDFYRQIELLLENGVEAVATGLLEEMEEASNTEQLLSYYLASLTHDLILLYLDESTNLSTFSGYQFEEIIDYYNRLIDKYEQLTRDQIRIRLSQNLPDSRKSNSEVSKQLAILKRIIRSKGRGTSIRQLFNMVGEVIRQMAPCFLMSPLSVAQYIDPNMPRFDLVIFDEASQIRTSVGIGAMSRAENCIIVGDPNQMPPTSFFTTQREREEYIEIEDLESLLEDCLAINMPERYLNWHYRSQSESLITFSNRMYYQSEMRTFPSPFDRISKVRYHKVSGIYDRGGSRTNQIEAEAIVDKIERHYMEDGRLDVSIGVVTFSLPQQNLVDDLLQERLRKNPEFDKVVQSLKEPIFIKNLENVQGDERDIILFSIGYGPDDEGKMTFNFGPLNRKGGWRRLNVAVSRSRQEMHIYASFEPEDIKLSQTSSEGLQGLRYFLEFARTGKLKSIGKKREQVAPVAADPWIESIAQFLEQAGYEVVRQLGFSDLNMDIAVVDPRMPDRYLCAIMVDGKQYAATNTVRDRNRLLPSVFARMGWQIHTVWALDWYDHSGQEKQKLLDFVAACLEMESPTSEKTNKGNKSTTVTNAKEVVTGLHLDRDAKTIASKRKELLDLSDQWKGFDLLQEGDQGMGDKMIKPIVKQPRRVPYQLFNLVNFYPSSAIKKDKDRVIRLCKEIVDFEYPIQEQVLLRRLSDVFSNVRLTKSVRNFLTHCLQKTNLPTTAQNEMLTYWPAYIDPNEYVEYRLDAGGGNGTRNLEEVSNYELANMVWQGLINLTENLSNQDVGVSVEDVMREVIRMLGYKQLTQKMIGFLNSAVENALERGLILRDSDKLKLPIN